VHSHEAALPEDLYAGGYLSGGNGSFGLDTSRPLFQMFLRFVCEARLDRLEQVLGRRGTLLDVGCGSGEFLDAAARRGWQVVGQEADEESAERSRDRGHEVVVAPVEEMADLGQRFDLVSANHVLEHMTEAVPFLRAAARCARDDGHVAIEVPNWGSGERRRSRASWADLRPLEHLAHYDTRTLSATLRRSGLDVVTCHTQTYLWHGFDAGIRLDAVIGTGWRRLGRPVERAVARSGPGRAEPGRESWTDRAVRVCATGHGRMGRGRVVLAVARPG
jgi:SAM-dependent methyltransferase